MLKIVLSGPCSTDFFRDSLGISLEGAPPGQAQTPIGPIAVELIRRGHEVVVLTLDSRIEQPERFKEGPIDIRFLPYRGLPKYRARVRSLDLFSKEIRWLTAETNAVNPDLVHAHWTYEYADAGLRSGYPLVVTAHDSPIHVLQQHFSAYRTVRLIMAASIIYRIKNLTVVSPTHAPYMRAMGFRGQIRVIPNGLNLEKLAQKNCSITENEKLVISAIGDTGHGKNISTLIKSFPAIKAAIPQAELHLFGPGLDDNYTDGEPGIIGHGQIRHPELIDFHQKSTVLLIHPSREEVCPVAILEAMALGIPAIGGYKSGGVPYVFGEKLKDCLVDINNPKAISEVAIRILQNRDLFCSISNICRDNVDQRFDIRTVVDDYEDVYHIALKR